MIRNKTLVSKILLLLLLCLTVLVVMTNFPTKRATSTSYASDFTVDTLERKDVTLQELKGKGVILSFWATYCPPCEKELPYLEKAYEKYEHQDVEIIAMNVSEPRLIVGKFIEKRALQLPIALDWNGSVAKQYEVMTLPTTIVINAKGEIVKRAVGEQNEEQIEALIQLVKP